MVRLGNVMLGLIRYGYKSFLYFITQKLGTCGIYKRALTGMAAVPASCAFFNILNTSLILTLSSTVILDSFSVLVYLPFILLPNLFLIHPFTR